MVCWQLMVCVLAYTDMTPPFTSRRKHLRVKKSWILLLQANLIRWFFSRRIFHLMHKLQLFPYKWTELLSQGCQKFWVQFCRLCCIIFYSNTGKLVLINRVREWYEGVLKNQKATHIPKSLYWELHGANMKAGVAFWQRSVSQIVLARAWGCRHGHHLRPSVLIAC